MSKVDDYRKRLRQLREWEPFLKKESGLPGPRGNLELAEAFCLEASPEQIKRLSQIGPDLAPENTPGCFLAFCGVMGLGRLVAQGQTSHLAALRARAADPRWRIREAVAMALQLVGDSDMHKLLREMRVWVRGNWYEKRAVAAATCEPRLLSSPAAAKSTLELLDRITLSMTKAKDRRDDGYQALRKGMAYCWSVAVSASPALGKPLFEKWLANADADIRWVMAQNLAKNRLLRMDSAWVRRSQRRMARPRAASS